MMVLRPKSAPLRIGVDAGGTFTDCVILEGSRVRILKVFSTPDDPAGGIAEGVHQLIEGTGESAANARLEIIHGTTVGTNALLERKGARVALITTAGFEDLIEIGRQNRPRLYDLGVRREPALVPRRLRFGVHERTAADARILQTPSKAALRQLVGRLRKADAESLALCFLFCYANPSNERMVAQALRVLGLPLSVSHEILPEFREYERISTVVVNAYLAPRLGTYLARLASAFGTRRFPRSGKPAVRISVMQSSGGITTAERAAREPVRTILSGPAGGVVATARLAQRRGIRQAISFDMGGTSTDVSLIDGAPRTTREITLGGFPVAVPVLDVHSVGAGGGSLARFDAGGALRVGPESAGAVPGPICYRRGGTRPTVTDAHLILGRLDADHFLGSDFRLDLEAASGIFAQFLKDHARRVPGRLLPRTPPGLARGILAVANATMERALRVISVERGHDPRDFALVSFGGAGGLHAADLARGLGIAEVIVPPDPGAFSALGVLLSDVVKDLSHSVLMPVPGSTTDSGDRPTPRARSQVSGRARQQILARGWEPFLQEIAHGFVRLERAGRAQFRAEGFRDAIHAERHVDLRYVGQSFELTVPFDRKFREAFQSEHERAYGHSQPGQSLEIVNLRLRLAIRTPKPAIGRTPSKPVRRDPPRAALLKRKSVWFEDEMMDTPLYQRSRLPPGTQFTGPAVVLEYSSTTVVPPDYACHVDSQASLVLTRPR